ncbi:hypothetical protein HQS1_62290 [Delftia lacustris]|nr:hypothetical protein HQS1_62290 [Delftia lacustris]
MQPQAAPRQQRRLCQVPARSAPAASHAATCFQGCRHGALQGPGRAPWNPAAAVTAPLLIAAKTPNEEKKKC